MRIALKNGGEGKALKMQLFEKWTLKVFAGVGSRGRGEMAAGEKWRFRGKKLRRGKKNGGKLHKKRGKAPYKCICVY